MGELSLSRLLHELPGKDMLNPDRGQPKGESILTQHSSEAGSKSIRGRSAHTGPRSPHFRSYRRHHVHNPYAESTSGF